MERNVEVKVEGPLSFVDMVRKDVHLLKKLQKDNRKMVMELNVFFDEEIERALEIKSARPLVMPVRELKSCYYRMNDGGIDIDMGVNVDELYGRLGNHYEKKILEEEFERKDYDLDETYRQCVMQMAREFTEDLTRGTGRVFCIF